MNRNNTSHCLKRIFMLLPCLSLLLALISCGKPTVIPDPPGSSPALSSSHSNSAQPSVPAPSASKTPGPSAISTPAPSESLASGSGTQPVSPSPGVPRAREPRLILNPEDPLAGNAAPGIVFDPIESRVVTPAKPDVLEDMPEQTYTSYRDGWALEEVVPIGFHSYITSNRSGAFLFEPVDVFSLCEVQPGGMEEEYYAVFDGNGRQITDVATKASPEGYTAWLPGGCWNSDGVSCYIDKNMNLYYPSASDPYSDNSGSHWVDFLSRGAVADWVTLLAPNGKQLVFHRDYPQQYPNLVLPKCEFTNDGYALLSTSEYLIAYDSEATPVWMLEYESGDYTLNRVFGLTTFDSFALANSSGKVALYDSNGKRLTDFLYDTLWAYDTPYPIVDVNGKCGLIDMTGKEVLPCIYRSISFDDNSPTGAILRKDGKYGYMADVTTGEWTLPCEYEGIEFLYQTDELCIKENGAYYIWKNGIKGKTVFDESFHRMPYLDDGIYITYDNFMQESIINADGIKLMENVNLIGPYDGPLFLYYDHEAKLYGYYNSAAEIVIPPQYELADVFRKGFAIVKKNGKIRLIDEQNQVIMDTIFNDVVCWNPETMVLAVNYDPDNTETFPWSHYSVPGSRSGLVRLIKPE